MQKISNSIANALEVHLLCIKLSNICWLSPLLKGICQVNGRFVDLEDEDDDRTIDEIISDAAGGKFYFFLIREGNWVTGIFFI